VDTGNAEVQVQISCNIFRSCLVLDIGTLTLEK
jgi:hypothetical protein